MSRLLSTKEVAARLSITPRAVVERVNRRPIPFTKLGRLIRVKEEDLELYIDRLTSCDVTEAVEKPWAANAAVE